MKNTLYLLFVLVTLLSCSQPLKVTANPDSTSATSGTMGSVKASDGTNTSGSVKPGKGVKSTMQPVPAKNLQR